MKLLPMLIFILMGCDNKPTEKPEWEKAVTTYRCNDEQMARVHAQAEWCDKNTTYYSTYCYGTALIRNCTKAEGQV